MASEAVVSHDLMWGTAAQRLERRTFNPEDMGLNFLAAVSKLGQFFSLHIALVHSAVEMSSWLETVVEVCERTAEC